MSLNKFKLSHCHQFSINTLMVGTDFERGSSMILRKVMKSDAWNIMAGNLQSKATRCNILMIQ